MRSWGLLLVKDFLHSSTVPGACPSSKRLDWKHGCVCRLPWADDGRWIQSLDRFGWVISKEIDRYFQGRSSVHLGEQASSILQHKKQKHTAGCVGSGDESDWKERKKREKKKNVRTQTFHFTMNKQREIRTSWRHRERERGRERENFDRRNGQNKLSWHAREISIVWLRAKQSWRDLPGQTSRTTVVTFPSRQMFPHHIFLNRTNDFIALLTSDASGSAPRSRLRRCGWTCVKHHSCRAKENVWNQRISYQMRGRWCFIYLLVTSMLFFSYNSSYRTRAWRTCQRKMSRERRHLPRRTDRLMGDQVKPFVQLVIIQRDELRGSNDNRLCVQGFSIPQAFVDG